MEMHPEKTFYPDANFTMRLTYGKVGDYYPRDAVHYLHYTTLKGVMEKEDPDNYEFIVDPKLKELYNNKDYGRYGENGKMIVCFTTDNIVFEPELQKSICVDIRYVLFIMDKFAGAANLINEMTIVE
jgi:hypothetical protein